MDTPRIGDIVYFSIYETPEVPALDKGTKVHVLPACVVRLRTPGDPTTRLDLYVMTLQGSNTYLNVPYQDSHRHCWWSWRDTTEADV